MMPILFIGHGSPMNAIEENQYTATWRAIAASIPRPKAILAISAHWVTNGTRVTAMERPPTIHDFSGFPAALDAMEYPAPGDPALAARIKEMLSDIPVPVTLDYEWGLDHGTWSILVHMYPEADIPVVQLGIDGTLTPEEMVRLGSGLAALRDEGVLIMGAGNVVHNLARMHPARPHEWAIAFERFVQETRGDAARLLAYGGEESAHLAADEHFLPVLYAAGAARGDPAAFFNAGIVLGSVSMLCIMWDQSTRPTT